MGFKDFERISREIGNEMETTLRHFVDTRVFMKREVILKIYTRQIRHLYNNTSRLSSNRGYVYRPVSSFERYYESKLFVDAFLHFHRSRINDSLNGLSWFRWIFSFFFFLFSPLKNYTAGIARLHTFLKFVCRPIATEWNRFIGVYTRYTRCIWGELGYCVSRWFSD